MQQLFFAAQLGFFLSFVNLVPRREEVTFSNTAL